LIDFRGEFGAVMMKYAPVSVWVSGTSVGADPILTHPAD
jgi:hypothetical protein